MTETKAKQTPESMPDTTALHGSVEDGSAHVVGIGDLRVVLIPDDDCWFAQGLEIDYAAQGDTIEDAQEKFQNGLAATVHEHLKIHGTINNILRIAPQGAWDLMLSATAEPHTFSQVTYHQISEIQGLWSLPFQGIKYLEQAV
jgi:hypothetical protein